MARKKGKSEIIYVETSKGKNYFAYDYYESEFGKRKRLYAPTKEELEEKIRHMREQEEERLAVYLPKTTMLKDWANYYFRSIIGKASASDLKRFMMLFETSVLGTDVDRDMTEITADDMKNFYLVLKNKYAIKNVITIDEVLRKIFQTANEKGIQTFDYSEVPVPEQKRDENFYNIPQEYIPNKKELEIILNYCLENYSVGSLMCPIIFAMFTGIPIAKTVKLVNENFDLQMGTVRAKKLAVPLDEKCLKWLNKYVAEKQLFIAEKANGNEEDTISISCYTYAPELSGMTSEQAMAFLIENSEVMNRFVKNYMENNPQDYVFVSRDNTPAAATNSQRMLKTIAEKCNLPQGITGTSLHKAFIVSELENGKSMELLKTRYGYKDEAKISEIKDDYDLKHLLL